MASTQFKILKADKLWKLNLFFVEKSSVFLLIKSMLVILLSIFITVNWNMIYSLNFTSFNVNIYKVLCRDTDIL